MEEEFFRSRYIKNRVWPFSQRVMNSSTTGISTGPSISARVKLWNTIPSSLPVWFKRRAPTQPSTPLIEDKLESLIKTIQDAVESDADLVMINAGSSAGSKDYTYHAISTLGEVFVHRRFHDAGQTHHFGRSER